MGVAEEDFTTDDLVLLLAEAGEIDAGVEVLEAIRSGDPSATGTIRLQARLFAADAVAPERRREVLLRLRDGRCDALARRGALLETCVALRLLNREFPDEPMWVDKLSRLEDVLLPLPNLHGDARRAHADNLIALGKTREAWELLREMVAESPMELELSRRADALRGLLFEPVHTRPYRDGDVAAARAEPATDPAETMALAQQDIARGDLRAALARVTAASPAPADAVRWKRYREALTVLVEVIGAADGAGSGSHDDETARIGMTEVVDLKIRAGALVEARDDARRQLAAHPDATESNVLVRRIAALDEVLGDAPRPPPPVAVAPVAESIAAAVPPVPVASIEVEILRDPPRPDDDDPTRRRSSLPATSENGTVEVKRRRIVRLG